MNDTRIPVQKRSIEKRKRILEAGFQLFCEKGYYKTNTIEIARHAKVSTGTVSVSYTHLLILLLSKGYHGLHKTGITETALV